MIGVFIGVAILAFLAGWGARALLNPTIVILFTAEDEFPIDDPEADEQLKGQ